MVMLDVVYSSVIEQKIEKKKKKLSNLDKKLINEIKKNMKWKNELRILAIFLTLISLI